MLVYRNNSPYAKLVRNMSSQAYTDSTSDTFEDDQRLIKTIQRDNSVGFEAFYESASAENSGKISNALSWGPPLRKERNTKPLPLSKIFHPRCKPRYSK
jgi:hypothetical protein